MNAIELNQLAQRVHQANIKWWQDPATGKPISRNKGELLMLVITELAEACEGERKNLMDDKLPHRRMAEVEMADAKIRLLDFKEGFKEYLFDPDRFDSQPLFMGNKGDMLLQICKSVVMIEKETMYLSLAIYQIDFYCKVYGYDIDGAFEEKISYNATREDHKHEARLQAGGKQW